MINMQDLDLLHSKIKKYGSTKIYYIANNVELRESYIDELVFKINPAFRVIELKLIGINNAYWEYLKFQKNPELYHTEEEHVWQDINTKYVMYYTVPNKQYQYINEFNPRVPSAIFGKRRILYKNNVIIGDYNDPSPINPIYTNVLSYNGMKANELLDLFNNGDLEWKYKQLDEEVSVDNARFKYVTSDWYILDIENFPRTEKHMININQKTAFFTENWKAQNFLMDALM